MKTPISKAEQFVARLASAGWVVQKKDCNLAEKNRGSDHLLELPQPLLDFCTRFTSLANPEETAWFYSIETYDGDDGSDFKWNEFEISSLDAALTAQQRADVESFWRQHVPFAASVASGYAYIAYRRADGAIVGGEEPEYEESSFVIAQSLNEFEDVFLKSLTDDSPTGWLRRFTGANNITN